MRTWASLSFLVTLAAALTACSSGPSSSEAVAETTQHLEATTLPQGADLSSPPEARLTFDPGWGEQVIGTLYGGSHVRLFVAPERFPQCGISGTVTAGIRFDDGTVTELTLNAGDTGWKEGAIDLPAQTKSIEVWFKSDKGDGCVEYDSDMGKNYRFAVHAWTPTVVHFGSDWNEVSDGQLQAGGVLVIDYDIARLPDCRARGHYGLEEWDILAHLRFNDGQEMTHSVIYTLGWEQQGTNLGKERGLGVFPLPDNVRSVQVWFENTQRVDPPYQPNACTAWDSNLGTNYSFPILSSQSAPARVGWVGDYDFVSYHRDAWHQGDVDPAYYFAYPMGGSETITWMEVAAWIPGLSDQSYGSTSEAAQASQSGVKAQAVTDALQGAVDGWGTMDLQFQRQQGNNFVYRFSFPQLFANPGGGNIPEGLYNYYFRFSVDSGSSWMQAGNENGHTRRFVVSNEQNCSLFPDHAPQGCPQARQIGWAGNWGGRFSHACDYRPGLTDPVTFYKSSGGHDCMQLSAEVWVPGLTDQSPDNPAAIRAEVETNISFSGGPLAQTVSYPLNYEGRVGNNYRYGWDVSQYVARADRGDYKFRFRFTADNGAHWYTIANSEGSSSNEFRTLRVRNDTNDVDTTDSCQNIELWEYSTNVFPTCPSYTVGANYDANYCEFFVGSFGKGHFSANGATLSWLEAYIATAAQDGELLNAGMLTRYQDGSGQVKERWSMGQQIAPSYWRTGFTYEKSAMGGPGSFLYTVQDFAFFIDVRRPSGQVVRLWMSDGGSNYTLGEVFSVPGTQQGGGGTELEYASESVGLFNQKRSCQH